MQQFPKEATSVAGEMEKLEAKVWIAFQLLGLSLQNLGA